MCWLPARTAVFCDRADGYSRVRMCLAIAVLPGIISAPKNLICRVLISVIWDTMMLFEFVDFNKSEHSIHYNELICHQRLFKVELTTSQTRFCVRTKSCCTATYGAVNNFKRLLIKAVCPLLKGNIYKTIVYVTLKLLLKGIIICMIYLLSEVRLVSELRHLHAVTEQIHSLDLEFLEIVRVFRVIVRKCRVRNEAHYYKIWIFIRKIVVEAHNRAFSSNYYVLYHQTNVRQQDEPLTYENVICQFSRVEQMISCNN